MSEKNDLENFPPSASAKRMLNYVSGGFYDNSYVGKWLFQVMGQEYDKALEAVESLPEQFFPETATWGLMYHEIKWNLPVRDNLSYEERRRLIYQKRDFRAPMTPYRMEVYLKNATGFEVHVADCNDPGDYGNTTNHPNTFEVFFIGDGTLDVEAVEVLLDKLKLSHTTYLLYDLVAGTMGNRYLEQFVLRSVQLRAQIQFWGGNLFDGSMKFDGSALFDSSRRYDLLAGLKYQEGGFEELGLAEPEAGLMVSGSTTNTVKAGNARAVALAGIAEQNSADAEAMQVTAIVGTGKEDIGVTVTEQKDLLFFDGSALFDGSKTFSAIYRKEEL